MRILLINTYYYPNMIGGTETVVKLLAEGFSKNGHFVVVFTLDNDDNKTQIDKINGVTVYRCRSHFLNKSKFFFLNKFFYSILQRCNFFIDRELKTVIKLFKPDIVHTHNLYGFSPRIWKILKKNNLQVLHTVNDYWLMKKSVRPFFKLYEKFVDEVVSPSKYVLDEYHCLGFFKNKGVVIYNGIRMSKDEFKNNIKKHSQINKSTIDILFVGQLIKIKGVDLLIKAFNNLNISNVHLNICGYGELVDLVKFYAKKNSKINYYGFVDSNLLNEIYLNNDLLIIPSMWEEPFGMIAIEGYYRGLQVFASDVGGLSEIVSKIGEGLLFHIKDEKSIENIILKFVNEYYKKKNFDLIMDNLFDFSLENQIDSLIALYNKLVRSSN